MNAAYTDRHKRAWFALSDGREYLMGSQFTTADILLTTCLTWAIDYGVGICDSAVPYLDRITSRAGYRAGERANFAQIGGKKKARFTIAC